MVPGCKQLLRQVDAFSAFKRKGRENVTNATLASFVLASTAVIIPHFHVGNVCFFFVFFFASCVEICISAIYLFSTQSRPHRTLNVLCIYYTKDIRPLQSEGFVVSLKSHLGQVDPKGSSQLFPPTVFAFATASRRR